MLLQLLLDNRLSSIMANFNYYFWNLNQAILDFNNIVMNSSSFTSPMQNQIQEEERLNQLREEFQKSARNSLARMNFQEQESRARLAQGYRKLQKILQNRLDNSFYLTEDALALQKIEKYAYKVRPFAFDNSLRYMSLLCKQQITGNRRCTLPVVKIDNQQIDFSGKEQKTISKDKLFLLEIQAEAHSFIIYTKSSVHPLLATQADGKQVRFERTMQQISPPCEFNIIVVRDPHKIQSHMLTLKVKHSLVVSSSIVGNFASGVRRPTQIVPFDESVSYVQQGNSFIQIEEDSDSK